MTQTSATSSGTQKTIKRVKRIRQSVAQATRLIEEHHRDGSDACTDYSCGCDALLRIIHGDLGDLLKKLREAEGDEEADHDDVPVAEVVQELAAVGVNETELQRIVGRCWLGFAVGLKGLAALESFLDGHTHSYDPTGYCTLCEVASLPPDWTKVVDRIAGDVRNFFTCAGTTEEALLKSAVGVLDSLLDQKLESRTRMVETSMSRG